MGWGHSAFIGNKLFIDGWGAGPFVIAVGGKQFRFEDSDRFGPALIKASGDLRESPYPAERSPFWRAHRIWRRQGRRVAEDGVTCVWDEPKPQTIRHIGGRHYEVVEAGEEDGQTITIPAINAETQKG